MVRIWGSLMWRQARRMALFFCLLPSEFWLSRWWPHGRHIFFLVLGWAALVTIIPHYTFHTVSTVHLLAGRLIFLTARDCLSSTGILPLFFLHWRCFAALIRQVYKSTLFPSFVWVMTLGASSSARVSAFITATFTVRPISLITISFPVISIFVPLWPVSIIAIPFRAIPVRTIPIIAITILSVSSSWTVPMTSIIASNTRWCARSSMPAWWWSRAVSSGRFWSPSGAPLGWFATSPWWCWAPPLGGGLFRGLGMSALVSICLLLGLWAVFRLAIRGGCLGVPLLDIFLRFV